MLPFLQGVARRPPEGLFAPASCPVIPSQSADWRGNPFPAPAGAELPLPPSVREVARLRRDGGRDITLTHPRCSSVGGDALIAPHTAPAVSFRASPQTGVGIRSPLPCFHASGGLFSFSSERKEEKKRRQKLRFWIFLRAFARRLSCLFLPRERCAMQTFPKYCIVSASWSAAAFAPKCRSTSLYRG